MSGAALKKDNIPEHNFPTSSYTLAGNHAAHPLLNAFAKAEHGSLSVVTPEGQIYHFSGEQPGVAAHIALKSWKTFDMLFARGEIGFAEAYMDGLWESDDLPALLTYGLLNADTLERYFYGKPLYALWIKLNGFLHKNSMAGSRRNIADHYDLGNDFYRLWLDSGMTYSCGLFGGNRQHSLETAQAAKYKRILNKLEARPGAHILDIGCGWGGFAEAAARAGLRVTGVTISKEQHGYAQDRLHNAGLNTLADVQLADYRSLQGQFDHIVSIGMFEHVGEKYWPAYFDTVKKLLKPGGNVMIQTITIDDEVFTRTHGKNGFIETYVFPGGMLPSRSEFRRAAEKSGLKCREMFFFGSDYAITTRKWLERFNAREKEVRAMGYDERFIRMWRMYLSSCIASFSTKRTDVMQTELVHMPQHAN